MSHLAKVRTDHHRLFLRHIGWKRLSRDGYPVLSYTDAPAKSSCDVVATVPRRKVLWSGFVARMGNERLPERVVFGNWRRKRVTWEGNSRRTKWVVSSAICR